MLKSALQSWVWSGINKASSENVNPTRITNIIALLCISVSSLHLPIVLYFVSQTGYQELLLIIISASLLTLVPILNRLKAYLMSKLFLVIVFATYILISCLIRQENLNIQYFFLLAVVICPFLFKEAESGLMFLITLSYFLLFVSFEIWFFYSSVNTLSFHQQIVKISCSISFALSCLLCSYHIRRNINRNLQKLSSERERSEQLLLNILPANIVQRLKTSPNLIADYYEQVSILFADIQNFTPLSKNLSPQQLVNLLNEVFCAFDHITQKYGLEKIKTSGDGYMVADIAHLGGAIVAFFFIRSMRAGNEWNVYLFQIIDFVRSSLQPQQRKRKKGFSFGERNYKKSGTKATSPKASNSDDTARMNEILDKIKASGYDSLSKEEKAFLFKISKD